VRREGDLRWGEFLLCVARRHDVLVVRGGDTEIPIALITFSGDHGGGAALPGPEHAGVRVEAELSFPMGILRAVTVEAVIRKGRQDVAAEVERGGSGRSACEPTCSDEE
jgi:hypothetical protein